MRNLGETRAELVDAHEAVDREVGGENASPRQHRIRDGLARPGKADDEELRNAGGEKQQHRGLAMLELGADGLGHEARRENEQTAECEQNSKCKITRGDPRLNWTPLDGGAVKTEMDNRQS